jgi:PhnB protein
MAKKAKKSAPKKAAKKSAAKKSSAKKSSSSKSGSKVKAVPAGWRTLTPGTTVKNAASAIRFYQALFGAKVAMKMDGPDGAVVHAELIVGDSRFTIGEAAGPVPAMPMHLMYYTNDVDKLFHQATASGCQTLQALEDQFWGDRTGRVADPYGNTWYFAQHVEDVSEAEMGRRYQKMAQGQPWKAAA